MQRVWIAIVIALGAGAIAPACKGGGGGVEVVAGAPAGDVTEVAGDVKATRDGKTRAIAKGDVVAGDDVIATGVDGRVTIVLRHNQVPWSLGPNKSKKVADSAAWSAAKGASGEEVTDDHSTAAGRHAERSATETGASLPAPAAQASPAAPAAETSPAPGAPAPAAAAAPAPPPPPAPAPPPTTEAQPEPEPAPAAAAAAAVAAPPAADEKAPPKPAAKGAPASSEIDLGDTAIGGAPGGGGKALNPTATARLTIGEVSTSGALENDVAARVVRTRNGIFRACYQRELQRDPSLAGLLSLTISIKADGTVTSSKVDGPDALGAVRDCIRVQVGHLKFPDASGASTVKAKMVLAPNG
jgi:outer membrane biosynthesis protein TonB